MKKPTMQDIANYCGVSRITVWKVLNHHTGVSEALRREIINAARTLNYPLPDSFLPPQPSSSFSPFIPEKPMTISIIVSRPNSSTFWSSIIHQIAKELTKLRYQLMYTYVPSIIPDDYQLPAQLSNGAVQGILVLNVYNPKLFTLLNRLPVPKVFLDIPGAVSPEELTGDLILLDGESTIRQITNHFIHKGYEEIGFIGDVHYALTNQLRYDGYLQALKEHHMKRNPVFCKTNSIGIHTYREEIFSYLDSLPSMPQVFVCVSDFVAHLVYQYLLQNNYQVPGDILLSGHDNAPDLNDLDNWLSTVNVNTLQLGKRLVFQLLYRLRNPEAAPESVLIRSEILLRSCPE